MAIVNRESLLKEKGSYRNMEARRIVLDIIDAVLQEIKPQRMISSKISVEEDILRINGKKFNLEDFGKIYIVGGGKASGEMAVALEEILEKRITAGVIAVPKDTSSKYQVKRIKILESSHPIPDQSSIKVAQDIMDVVSQAKKDDLVFCLISGGGSSLMTLPREGITIQDLQTTNNLLLLSGATINEINSVRKHISRIKGGQLAKTVLPATLFNIIISDVIGDPLDVIASGPTVPDNSTFRDAIATLKKYNLWMKSPDSIKKTLNDGLNGNSPETLKIDDLTLKKIHTTIIGNNRLACESAKKSLESQGLKSIFLTSSIEGEAKHVGSIIGAIGREIIFTGNPSPPPCGIIAGGETTVTVKGKGCGGRNQETALAASLKIEGLENIAIASFATDGIDGPTDAAGAIVDGETRIIAKKNGIKAEDYLENNDSYSFFSIVGGLINTGSTGTNVCDIIVMVVL